jgi:rSAM/selenodomain-associated transferase 1
VTAVLIMARAPRPGATKTRLEPLLGPDGCAQLQSELIRHTATWATQSGRDVWLAYTPGNAHDELAPLVPPTVRLFPQSDGDLGARLRAATRRIFRSGARSVTVIGTDAPTLDAGHLEATDAALSAGNDACLVPALDGGYALIALSRLMPEAFDLPRASWGGPHVLALTLGAIATAGRTAHVLDPVADLDVPADAVAMLEDPALPRPIRRLLAGALITV